MWILLYIIVILCSVFFIPYVPDEFRLPKSVIYLIGSLSVISAGIIYPTNNLMFKNKWIGFILLYTILSFGYYFFVPQIFPDDKGRILWNIWCFVPNFNIIVGIILLKILF